MEKIRPNYIVYLLITQILSLILISLIIGTPNFLQIITLILAPCLCTLVYKYSYESSPYGYFISENEITYKDKKSEITTNLRDIKFKKTFFSPILVLNGGKNIELCFYDRKLLEKYLNFTKLT